MNNASRRRQRQRGQAIVELTLLAVIVVVASIGILTVLGQTSVDKGNGIVTVLTGDSPNITARSVQYQSPPREIATRSATPRARRHSSANSASRSQRSVATSPGSEYSGDTADANGETITAAATLAVDISTTLLPAPELPAQRPGWTAASVGHAILVATASTFLFGLIFLSLVFLGACRP
jgi:hypothetical protein